MKRALLLGDNRDGHPLYGVLAPLNRALEGALAVETQEDPKSITLDRLRAYDVVINYAGGWDSGARAAAAALVAYVADGGGYMALHEGLNTPRCDELSLMAGARYSARASQVLLDFRPGPDAHPIGQWLPQFKVTEEPCRYEIDVFRRSQVLLEYRYGYAWYPAAWCHPFLLGKVFCFMPGHSAESFIPPVRQLLYKAGLWLTDRL